MKMFEKFVMFLGIIIVVIPQIIAHYVLEIRDWLQDKFVREDNNV